MDTHGLVPTFEENIRIASLRSPIRLTIPCDRNVQAQRNGKYDDDDETGGAEEKSDSTKVNDVSVSTQAPFLGDASRQIQEAEINGKDDDIRKEDGPSQGSAKTEAHTGG
jgi:hypothetical protein